MCEKAMEQIGIQKKYRSFYLHQVCTFGVVILVFLAFLGVNCSAFFDDEMEAPVYVKVIILIVLHYPIGLLYVADVSFLHWVRYDARAHNQNIKVIVKLLEILSL